MLNDMQRREKHILFEQKNIFLNVKINHFQVPVTPTTILLSILMTSSMGFLLFIIDPYMEEKSFLVKWMMLLVSATTTPYIWIWNNPTMREQLVKTLNM